MPPAYSLLLHLCALNEVFISLQTYSAPESTNQPIVELLLSPRTSPPYCSTFDHLIIGL